MSSALAETPTSAADVATAVRDAGGPLLAMGRGGLASRLGLTTRDRRLLSVSALDRVIEHRPDDQVITVGSGLSVAALDEVLAGVGQECPLDPWWSDATVGGTVAAGFNGYRRCGRGPIRDLVLGIEAVTGNGEVVRAGGKTVKNVTGYDVCRLLVGSLGRWAVLTEVTLRTQPRPEVGRWYRMPDDPGARPARPSAHLVAREGELILMEGAISELDAWERRVSGERVGDAVLASILSPVRTPAHRIAVDPASVQRVTRALPPEVGWVAEPLFGIVHLSGRFGGARLDRLVGEDARVLSFDGTGDGLLAATAPDDDALDTAVGNAFDARAVLDWRRP